MTIAKTIENFPFYLSVLPRCAVTKNSQTVMVEKTLKVRGAGRHSKESANYSACFSPKPLKTKKKHSYIDMPKTEVKDKV